MGKTKEYENVEIIVYFHVVAPNRIKQKRLLNQNLNKMRDVQWGIGDQWAMTASA